MSEVSFQLQCGLLSPLRCLVIFNSQYIPRALQRLTSRPILKSKHSHISTNAGIGGHQTANLSVLQYCSMSLESKCTVSSEGLKSTLAPFLLALICHHSGVNQTSHVKSEVLLTARRRVKIQHFKKCNY